MAAVLDRARQRVDAHDRGVDREEALVPVPIPLFGYVLTGGYGGSLYLAWHLLSNTAGEPPEIKRRV
jgi:hypothetical protein